MKNYFLRCVYYVTMPYNVMINGNAITEINRSKIDLDAVNKEIAKEILDLDQKFPDYHQLSEVIYKVKYYIYLYNNDPDNEEKIGFNEQVGCFKAIYNMTKYSEITITSDNTIQFTSKSDAKEEYNKAFLWYKIFILNNMNSNLEFLYKALEIIFISCNIDIAKLSSQFKDILLDIDQKLAKEINLLHDKFLL